MARNYTFKFIKFEDKSEKIGCFLIVAIISFSFILLPIWIFFPHPEADKFVDLKSAKSKSAEFVLSYDTPDLDFGTIDYSGISYFIDGFEYFTDASGIIQHNFNDGEWHTFELLWHGILNTFTFNESISESVSLETKNIEVSTLWDEIFTPVEGIDVEIWYYSGTTWSLIETAITDSSGVATISSLVMGLYVVCEVGSFAATNNFTVDQLTITYTTELLFDAVKTIIDVDYLNTIFGIDYSVNLADITWAVLFSTQAPTPGVHCDGVIVDEVTGKITYYNLIFDWAWEFIVYNYAGVAKLHTLLVEGLNEVDLVAKSLEASFEWSFDNTPVIGYEVELFWFDGVDYILIGTYTTDADGKVIITEMLPIGQYRLNDNIPFVVVASDIIKIEQCVVESTAFWEKGSFLFIFYELGHRNKHIFFFKLHKGVL